MPANYVLLEKITVGAAGAASVTFSGIPQTGYTDLVVRANMRSNVSGTYGTGLYLEFNGNAASAYTVRALEGYDSSASSYVTGPNTFINAGGVVGTSQTANTFNNFEMYIPNYTSSNYKSTSIDNVEENNSATGWDNNLAAVLWANTSAITSIKFTPNGGNFVQYSTFYLYGVAALGTTPVIVPYATGGDTIMTDGTYWYHTFISSGTFTPASGKTLTCDYLVVAGGGGGGAINAGGGGAGGLRSTVTATGGGGSLESPLSLGSSAYTVTIGAGGAGATTIANGTNGSNSVFSTITSTGGGGGATYNAAGSTGGSGGGGGGDNGATGRAGGAGTANQGYAGGKGINVVNRIGGGGGGASAVGAAAVESGGNLFPGNGGNGVATSITGSSVTYAGGGGGSAPGTGYGNNYGVGGTGGGGTGSMDGGNAATAGTVNLGGGGGGGAGYNGAAGGSGIVIVRYAV